MKQPKWEKQYWEIVHEEGFDPDWTLAFIYNLLKTQRKEVEKDTRKEIKDRQKKSAEEFDNKYPTRTIGNHHYIRRRYLGRFLQEQRKELLDSIEEEIEKIERKYLLKFGFVKKIIKSKR